MSASPTTPSAMSGAPERGAAAAGGLMSPRAAWLRRRARALAALAAFVVAFVFHAAQIPSQGLTDDDDFYAPAGIRYAEWLGDAVTHPSLAFTQASIESAFKLNHEHPPGAKLVFGVAHALAHAIGFGDLDAARVGCALFAAALASLLVRPDGFVAWASDTTPSAEDVTRAAARWFTRREPPR